MSWTFPGALQNNVFRSDPVLSSDNTGRFFYLSLFVGQTMFDDMWRSLNGGQFWTDLATATGGDKQWFTIDNTNSTGHGFHYQSWDTSNNYGAVRHDCMSVGVEADDPSPCEHPFVTAQWNESGFPDQHFHKLHHARPQRV